jgi:uncharacterized protein YueI
MIPCLNLIYSFFQIELSPWQPFSSTRTRCYFSRCSFSRCSPCLPCKSQLSLCSAGMEFRLKVNVVSDMKMTTEIQIIFSAFRIINKLKTDVNRLELMIPCLKLIYSFFQIELSPWQPLSSTRTRCYFSRCSPCLPCKSQLSLCSAGMEFRLKVNVVSVMKMTTEIQMIFSAFRIINKLKTDTIFSFLFQL